jgi:tryptophan halogenase
MKIIIVGSGSAGLITALMLNNNIPDVEILIIKSQHKKIIGVGESTVGSFNTFLVDLLGIDKNDFIINVKPVTKYGISFEFGKNDFHYTFDTVFDYEFYNEKLPIGFKFNGGNYGNSEFSTNMINKSNPYKYNTGAYHVDNRLFIDYLEKISHKRGIKFINDDIISVKREGDNIVSLNEKYVSDYFIDCSGFKPVLSNEKFYSYEDVLVNDRALFFRTKTTDTLKPYTQSTTMNCGWLWRIDHSTGFTGNGYVYSSKYITDEEAKKEVEQKLKIKLENSRIIPFKTGRLEKHWVGNVITVGNSDGFVEPLEATSLMTILQLSKDFSQIIKYGDNKGDLINRYNDFTNIYYDNIRDFILLHFCFNKRKDTKYWSDYSKRVNKLKINSQSYEILYYYLNNDVHIKYLSQIDELSNPFGYEGYYSILRGLIPTDDDRKELLTILNDNI